MIEVRGILINEEGSNYLMYKSSLMWERVVRDVFTISGPTTWLKELARTNDIECLISNTHEELYFVVVYEAPCSKIDQIKRLVAEINRVSENCSLPPLVAIGDDSSTWTDEITSKVREIRAVKNTGNQNELLQGIVEEEMQKIKRELYAPEPCSRDSVTQIPQEKFFPMHNISMMVLSGFIAVAGINAIAIAFTLLNAAALGTSGLVVAGFGVAGILAGVGLFAVNAYKHMNASLVDDLDNSIAATI
jgi:hypothetical protein